MREFALAKDMSLRVFWVGFGSKSSRRVRSAHRAHRAGCRESGCRESGRKKKSLGAHSERNVKKKVAYLFRFRDPKSLGAHSGDRSFRVFAYLEVLLGGHFPMLQYLTRFLRGHTLHGF